MALIPPPRYPLVRYHGVLAPSSPYRSRVVPRPPPGESTLCRPTSSERKRARKRAAADHVEAQSIDEERVSVPARSPTRADTCARTGCATPHPALVSTIARGRPADESPIGACPSAAARFETSNDFAARDETDLLTNVLPIAHWHRLLGGLLVASSPRLNWATLLRRTYATDVLSCPRCHERMRVLAAITAPDVARQILARLGVAIAAPQAARARDPTWAEWSQMELPPSSRTPRSHDALPPSASIWRFANSALPSCATRRCQCSATVRWRATSRT